MPKHTHMPTHHVGSDLLHLCPDSWHHDAFHCQTPSLNLLNFHLLDLLPFTILWAQQPDCCGGNAQRIPIQLGIFKLLHNIYFCCCFWKPIKIIALFHLNSERESYFPLIRLLGVFPNPSSLSFPLPNLSFCSGKCRFALCDMFKIVSAFCFF